MESIPIYIPDKKNILYIIGNIRQEETGGIEGCVRGIAKFLEGFKPFFAKNRREFDDIIQHQDISIIHIHSLLGFGDDFYEDLLSLNIPIVITLHDWYLICPRVQLFTPWGERCIYSPGKRCPACYFGKTRITRHLKWNNLIISRLFLLLPKIRKWSRIYKSHWKAGIRFLKQVNTIIAPSEYVKSRFESFGLRGIISIPCGIQNIESIPKGYKKRLGFVGTIVPHKGLHILLQALKGLPEDFILNIYGKIGDERYFNKWEKFIDNKRIFYKGEEKNKNRIFENIDILIVPSLWEETYGIVIDEAWTAKIPVIASRIGGIPEHMIEGKSGYLFTSGSISELRDRIIYILKNYEDIEWEYPEVMPVERYAQIMEEIYERLGV